MDIDIGSVVRIPLGGRRVRGWVVSLRRGDAAGLKQVVGVSGAYPIFTQELLQTLRWAAVHYLAPLSVMLPKSGPPNLPRAGKIEPAPVEPPPAGAGPPGARLQEFVAGKAAAAFIVSSGPWIEILEGITGAAAAADRSSLVIVPTARDCHLVAAALAGRYPRRVVEATSAAPAAERTQAWSRLRAAAGTILVGTPEVALWPLPQHGVAVVVEPARRAMKARQTPTLHVREIMRKRAAVERTTLALLGQVPTLESLAAGVAVIGPSGRAWPLIEIADRTVEPPSSAGLAEATRVAIAGAARRGQLVFVFVSRRGYAPALRCSSCSELRRCPECGSSPGPAATCERCGAGAGPCTSCGRASFAPVGLGAGRVLDELRRAFGSAATPAGEGGTILVGTERDIPTAASVDFAAVVDADSMLLRPHFRAEEETLRVLARVAAAVRRGRGHRCLIQTRMPEHRVFTAMRHGSGDTITAEWLTERAAERLPPFGQLAAVELTGADAAADEELRRLAGPAAAVFGPAVSGDQTRWLLQAPDLRPMKVRLRPQLQSWRDRGIKVRVDADPLDV